ncbi:MAG TPA: CYTH domain-containing protein [Marinospirillum sp.]|uniref:CYTH domain-containing protein n=1 Tax=Marinospirillum sp. TaxID=2183934 RepID=UPI002B4A2C96|nr:CYTH domain-containing protein [Marinospirillum sp.]HKM14884.1 CYTH domain-containing protein [Marinospirillum sp.]
MAKEIELKLLIRQADFKQLEALMLQYQAKPQGVKRLENTYFDTPDLHLNQAKAALRLRFNAKNWVQTLKTSGTNLGALSERGEWEMPVSEGKLDLALFPEGVLSPDWKNELTAQFNTNFTRKTWLLTDMHSEIELAADMGEVLLPNKIGQAQVAKDVICELELELKKGDTADLFKLANQLAAHLIVHPGVLSKAERGLRLLRGTTAVEKPHLCSLNSNIVSFADLSHLAGQELNRWILAHENFAFNANENELLQAHRALLRLYALLVLAQRLCTAAKLYPAIKAVKILIETFLPWVESCWQDRALQRLALDNFDAEWRSTQLGYAARRSEYRRLWHKNWVGQASLLLVESLFSNQHQQACTQQNKAEQVLQDSIAKLGLPQQPMDAETWLKRYPSLVRVELLLQQAKPADQHNQQLMKQMQAAIEVLNGYEQLLRLQYLTEGVKKIVITERHALLLQLGRMAQALWIEN